MRYLHRPCGVSCVVPPRLVYLAVFGGVVRTAELCPAFVNDLSEDEQLAYTAAFARNREHELVMGLPLSVHFQMFLSFASGRGPARRLESMASELERWAEAGNRGNRGDRDRGGAWKRRS